MMKKLLIDTNVFVDYLMGDLHAREFFEQLPEGIFYYTALTKLELLATSVCADASVRNSTTALLSLGKRVEIDDTIISLAAEEKRKHNLSLPGSILAATALHLKAELVTKNIGEFKKINELMMMKPY